MRDTTLPPRPARPLRARRGRRSLAAGLASAWAWLLLPLLAGCASSVGHPQAPDLANLELSQRDEGTFDAAMVAEYDAARDLTGLLVATDVKAWWVGMWMELMVDGTPAHFTIKAVSPQTGRIVVRGDATATAMAGASFLVMDTRAYVVGPVDTTIAGPQASATTDQLQAQLEDQLTYFSEYRLQYEDAFTVLLLEHPEWTTRVRVLRDGNIYFGFYSATAPPRDGEEEGEGEGGEDNGGSGSDGDGGEDGSGSGSDGDGSGDGDSGSDDTGDSGAGSPDDNGRADADGPRPGRAMHVVGKTIAEVQAMLMEALRRYFIDPQIKIEDIEQAPTSWTVKVMGAVNRPGRVKVLAGYRILDALADVGGVHARQFVTNVSDLQPLLPLVDWRAATISREARFLPAGTAPAGARPSDLCRLGIDFVKLVSGDNRHNVPLFPGDVIHIPPYEAQNTRVTVAGKVNVPGVYYFREQIDLIEALARAGWIIEEDAKYSGVYLVRNSIAPDGQRDLYILNPINVARGSARNIPLRDGDIVYVDTSSLHDMATVATKIRQIIGLTTETAASGNEWRTLFERR